jgi:hypothetical protein
LIHEVTRIDPGWVVKFVPYLRDVMNMRSASIVVAAEYVAAGGRDGRKVVNAAISRADEPGEMLAYWRSTHGRKLPAAIKRGVADACTRLYTERNVLKYDGVSRDWRFADVIELVHPKPSGPWQSVLWATLLDRRHHDDSRAWVATEPGLLPTMLADMNLRALPEADRRGALGGADWNAAGWSWERLSGWLPGGMDAQAWEAVIPQMGYMALLRNLRNFDDANIAQVSRAFVNAKLANPREVARSRQFPFRFYSAYREIATLQWAPALERALDLSLLNVPRFSGRTLVLIDTSASMRSTLSGRSKRSRVEIAALFGIALIRAAAGGDLVLYASQSGVHNEIVREPLLRGIDTVVNSIGWYDHGTMTFTALDRHYQGHDRVVIVTDDQSHDAARHFRLPDVPIFTFDVGGYGRASLDAGQKNHYTLAGLNDKAFDLLPMLEQARDGHWPFL